MKIQTKCAICDTTDNSTVVLEENLSLVNLDSAVFSARRSPDQQYFRWVKCNSCSLMRSDPVFELNLKDLYAKSTFDYSSEVMGLKRTYWKLVRRALSDVEFKKSIFEIGGGNGFFLEEAKDRGFQEILGIEPSESAISAARSDIQPYMIQDIVREGLIKKDAYEVGVMFHTLDHLPNPVAVLRICFDALEHDGVFVAAVHNANSWSAKILKQKSPIFDLEHTYLFSQTTLKKLFEKVGFRDVSTFNYSNSYSLFYLIHLMPISTRLKSTILNSRIARFLIRIRFQINLGNMAVIAYKRV
jgi:SAM-dependent methyltransferase